MKTQSRSGTRTGSAILLVVAVLAILSMVGAAMLAIARNERRKQKSSSLDTTVATVIKGLVAALQAKLKDDLVISSGKPYGSCEDYSMADIAAYYEKAEGISRSGDTGRDFLYSQDFAETLCRSKNPWRGIDSTGIYDVHFGDSGSDDAKTESISWLGGTYTHKLAQGRFRRDCTVGMPPVWSHVSRHDSSYGVDFSDNYPPGIGTNIRRHFRYRHRTTLADTYNGDSANELLNNLTPKAVYPLQNFRYLNNSNGYKRTGVGFAVNDDGDGVPEIGLGEVGFGYINHGRDAYCYSLTQTITNPDGTTSKLALTCRLEDTSGKINVNTAFDNAWEWDEKTKTWKSLDASKLSSPRTPANVGLRQALEGGGIRSSSNLYADLNLDRITSAGSIPNTGTGFRAFYEGMMDLSTSTPSYSYPFGSDEEAYLRRLDRLGESLGLLRLYWLFNNRLYDTRHRSFYTVNSKSRSYLRGAGIDMNEAGGVTSAAGEHLRFNLYDTSATNRIKDVGNATNQKAIYQCIRSLVSMGCSDELGTYDPTKGRDINKGGYYFYGTRVQSGGSEYIASWADLTDQNSLPYYPVGVDTPSTRVSGKIRTINETDSFGLSGSKAFSDGTFYCNPLNLTCVGLAEPSADHSASHFAANLNAFMNWDITNPDSNSYAYTKGGITSYGLVPQAVITDTYAWYQKPGPEVAVGDGRDATKWGYAAAIQIKNLTYYNVNISNYKLHMVNAARSVDIDLPVAMPTANLNNNDTAVTFYFYCGYHEVAPGGVYPDGTTTNTTAKYAYFKITNAATAYDQADPSVGKIGSVSVDTLLGWKTTTTNWVLVEGVSMGGSRLGTGFYDVNGTTITPAITGGRAFMNFLDNYGIEIIRVAGGVNIPVDCVFGTEIGFVDTIEHHPYFDTDTNSDGIKDADSKKLLLPIMPSNSIASATSPCPEIYCTGIRDDDPKRCRGTVAQYVKAMRYDILNASGQTDAALINIIDMKTDTPEDTDNAGRKNHKLNTSDNGFGDDTVTLKSKKWPLYDIKNVSASRYPPSFAVTIDGAARKKTNDPSGVDSWDVASTGASTGYGFGKFSDGTTGVYSIAELALVYMTGPQLQLYSTSYPYRDFPHMVALYRDTVSRGRLPTITTGGDGLTHLDGRLATSGPKIPYGLFLGEIFDMVPRQPDSSGGDTTGIVYGRININTASREVLRCLPWQFEIPYVDNAGNLKAKSFSGTSVGFTGTNGVDTGSGLDDLIDYVLAYRYKLQSAMYYNGSSRKADYDYHGNYSVLRQIIPTNLTEANIWDSAAKYKDNAAKYCVQFPLLWRGSPEATNIPFYMSSKSYQYLGNFNTPADYPRQAVMLNSPSSASDHLGYMTPSEIMVPLSDYYHRLGGMVRIPKKAPTSCKLTGSAGAFDITYSGALPTDATTDLPLLAPGDYIYPYSTPGTYAADSGLPVPKIDDEFPIGMAYRIRSIDVAASTIHLYEPLGGAFLSVSEWWYMQNVRPGNSEYKVAGWYLGNYGRVYMYRAIANLICVNSDVFDCLITIKQYPSTVTSSDYHYNPAYSDTYIKEWVQYIMFDRSNIISSGDVQATSSELKGE